MELRSLVVGVGNPSRRDDGIGFEVANQLQRRGLPPRCNVTVSQGDWLSLLGELAAYDQLIVVDAIAGISPPGTIVKLKLSDLPEPRQEGLSNAHEFDLVTAIELARRLDVTLPDDVWIFGIVGEDVSSFSRQCSPGLSRSINAVCEEILRCIQGGGD
jgi:hydrogenase maturation protease